jgi:hypothetical protein
VWKTKEKPGPKKPRGRKAQLPPRVPTSGYIPRLTHRLLRKKTAPSTPENARSVEIDFASPKIMAALGISVTESVGVSAPPEVSLAMSAADQSLALEAWATGDKALSAGLFAEQNIRKEIRELVAMYCFDCEQQLAPKTFRLGLNKFYRRLSALIDDFPTGDAGLDARGTRLPRERNRIILRSALSEALDRELERLGAGGLDIQTILAHLQFLQSAVEHLQNEEKGRGPDGDRSKHKLIVGLARIFEERTGEKPQRSYTLGGGVTGKFANFVNAVNEKIPQPYRISNFDTLIRAVA